LSFQSLLNFLLLGSATSGGKRSADLGLCAADQQARWHICRCLIALSNITIVPIPARLPELNPVENVRQFMRDNGLSNPVLKSYSAIFDHCFCALRQLADQLWRIMSTGRRKWSVGFDH